MADYIKYFTNPMFRGDEFVDMLKEKMNVRACVVEGGVVLDREAFNAVRVAYMPHWAYINRKYINSNLHTRPAMLQEIPQANKMHYTLMIYADNTDMELEQSDKLDYIKGQADTYAKMWRAAYEKFCVMVIDNTTGEVMHETN